MPVRGRPEIIVASAVERHVPVLEREVCRALVPALTSDAAGAGGVFVDATCGMAGHTRVVIACTRPRLVIGFDRDPVALSIAQGNLDGVGVEVRLVDAPFSSIAVRLREQGITEVAAILADIGVSSLQLDDFSRGFSWREDAPLDMRMDPRHGQGVAELLAVIDVAELTRILREYGDEPEAQRIARAIVAARPRTTFALAELVGSAMSAPARRKLGMRIHPATRTFQALRIHVNDELGELDRLLADAPELLAIGGRLAIISFHSLEDRRVKRRFAELSSPPAMPAHVPLRADELPQPRFRLPEGFARGVIANDTEIENNPRARSARLRVLERTHA
ncbi:MAG: 16S rRNA (cytosine(1402)-N(4))-methyltransferase RsmH [Deltaproteobacteria bacterium]|nr:16S rRNA (cytosine(1402)-N(4))-methyltransferase RsmH [Nannocystaceae bacterium]